jgi:hypothetical protein
VCLFFLLAQSESACAEPGPAECIAADQAPLRNWNDLYRYYRKYNGLCADGAQAEGLAEVVAELLDSQWETLPELQVLTARQPAFRRWILSRPIMYAEDHEVARRALANLKSRCQPAHAKLCEALAAKVVVE